MTFRQHAEKLGAEFLEATVHSVEERGDYKCVYAGDRELETRTVILLPVRSMRSLVCPVRKN